MPQILINREPLRHLNFDVELLGDCDVIVNELLLRLDSDDEAFADICTNKKRLDKVEGEEAHSVLFNNNNNNNSEATANNYQQDLLKPNSFLYLEPNMYVFHGAELSPPSARKKLRRLRSEFRAKLDDSELEDRPPSDMNFYKNDPLANDEDDDDSSDTSDDDDDDEKKEEESSSATSDSEEINAETSHLSLSNSASSLSSSEEEDNNNTRNEDDNIEEKEEVF